MVRRKIKSRSGSRNIQRTFSGEFKKRKVREIEQGICRVSDVCKEYEVSSTSVYKWIHKYSTTIKKPIKVIVEHQSDTVKIQELRKRLAQLEQLLGKKQVELEFKDKMIDLAEETYDVDIKKKFGGEQ